MRTDQNLMQIERNLMENRLLDQTERNLRLKHEKPSNQPSKKDPIKTAPISKKKLAITKFPAQFFLQKTWRFLKI
jgi:hypothetical protein